jgi:uncharacterized glyoxalase superfamily protein PhnB
MTETGTKQEPIEAFRGELAASLTVNDIHRSLSFYHEIVGFAVDRRFEREGSLRAVSLRAGDARILITQDDGVRGFDRAKGVGFSLSITTSADVDAIARRIEEHGGELDAPPADSPWGARVFRLRDPDGFRLVIMSGRG